MYKYCSNFLKITEKFNFVFVIIIFYQVLYSDLYFKSVFYVTITNFRKSNTHVV